jgi:hypothetical protein
MKPIAFITYILLATISIGLLLVVIGGYYFILTLSLPTVKLLILIGIFSVIWPIIILGFLTSGIKDHIDDYP